MPEIFYVREYLVLNIHHPLADFKRFVTIKLVNQLKLVSMRNMENNTFKNTGSRTTREN